jgi:hypothetical protein
LALAVNIGDYAVVDIILRYFRFGLNIERGLEAIVQNPQILNNK